MIPLAAPTTAPLRVHICKSVEGGTVDFGSIRHERDDGFIWVSRNACRLRKYSVTAMLPYPKQRELAKFESSTKAITYARSLNRAQFERITGTTPDSWSADPRTRALLQALRISYRYLKSEENASEGTDAHIMQDSASVRSIAVGLGIAL